MSEKLLNSVVKNIESGIPIIFLENSTFYQQILIEQIYSNKLKDNIYVFNSFSKWNYPEDNKEYGSVMSLKEIAYSLNKYEVGNNLVIFKGFEDELSENEFIINKIFSDIAQNVLDSSLKNLTIIFIGDKYAIPNRLKKYSAVVNNGLPNKKEISEIANTFFKYQLGELNLSYHLPEYFVNSLVGLNEFEIEQTLSMIFYEYGMNMIEGYSIEIENKILNEIKNIKRQFIKKLGSLTLIEELTNFEDIGGLNNLKSYIKDVGTQYKNSDLLRKKSIDLPKGVLILGKPGNGKSLLAKATANEMNLPLIKFDISKILGKYVGESEKQMQSTLNVIQAMSPCVLWIDEIEKTFAGINNENNDTMRKILGLFLTWMSDDNQSVFVVATANSIDNNIPPELVRKGRFDEIFYVNNPSLEDRKKIFELHLKRRKITSFSKNVINDLAHKSANLSGAEIEYICNKTTSKYYISNSLDDGNNNLLDNLYLNINETLSNKNKIELENSLNDKLESIYKDNKDLVDLLEKNKDSKDINKQILNEQIKNIISKKINETISSFSRDKENQKRYKKA
ncbi:AAA family ATPase [Staphylococcus hominis subsp. hominis]|uniref:AAA family ATPase n=1 Tax=Staphylococcus hominis TaxID=1290 RepID=UPI001FF807F9|nr:AAA family ATPase [Staphylococcus hominis]MCI3142878.1 AAA family ATPase [Staphylococcus hominis subsp. hominis]